MFDQQIYRRQQGSIGEKALNDWFQGQQLPYVSICQNPDTFSTLFPGYVKRPDFLLLMPSLGTLAIDAKNYKLSGNVFTLELEEELLKSVAFERLFRFPVWYAYMDPNANGQVWYFISALKAVEVGKVRKNGSTGADFLAIHITDFERVCVASDLAKLYNHRLVSIENIARLPADA